MKNNRRMTLYRKLDLIDLTEVYWVNSYDWNTAIEAYNLLKKKKNNEKKMLLCMIKLFTTDLDNIVDSFLVNKKNSCFGFYKFQFFSYDHSTNQE